MNPGENDQKTQSPQPKGLEHRTPQCTQTQGNIRAGRHLSRQTRISKFLGVPKNRPSAKRQKPNNTNSKVIKSQAWQNDRNRTENQAEHAKSKSDGNAESKVEYIRSEMSRIAETGGLEHRLNPANCELSRDVLETRRTLSNGGSQRQKKKAVCAQDTKSYVNSRKEKGDKASSRFRLGGGALLSLRHPRASLDFR